MNVRSSWHFLHAGSEPDIVLSLFVILLFFFSALNRKLYCRGQSRKREGDSDSSSHKMTTDCVRWILADIILFVCGVEPWLSCLVWKCVFNAILCPQEHCANERPSVRITASTTVSIKNIVVIVDCQCAAGLVRLHCLSTRERGGRQSNMRDRVFFFGILIVIWNTQNKELLLHSLLFNPALTMALRKQNLWIMWGLKALVKFFQLCLLLVMFCLLFSLFQSHQVLVANHPKLS